MVLLPADVQTAHSVRLSLPMNVFPPDHAEIACSECVMDCHDAACTQECTDQCVIVACDDPNHEAVPCVEVCSDAVCDGDLACVVHNPSYPATSIERHRASQTERHEYHDDPRPFQTPTFHSTHSQTWDEAFDAWFCSCGNTFPIDGSTSGHSYASPALSNSSQSASFGTISSSFTSALNYPPHYQSPPIQSLPPPRHSPPMPPPPPHHNFNQRTDPLACMWNNCGQTFSSLSELVGHVNLQHLRASSHPAPSVSSHVAADADLSCQWNNCNDYPTAHAIPGNSTSTSLDAALGVLANHLLQDHLGLQHTFDTVTSHRSHTNRPPTPFSLPASQHPTPKLRASSLSSVGGDGVQVCRWHACGLAFETVDDLTAHIGAEHVGGGRARYECFWAGCTRNGDKGFSSKQKICRHIQSHTGHRPFQCKLCKQHFSEAATLQQHMRRHTQEKPYVCDVAGCGKAFAIAGALTIHKRTHNGDKPFRCTYCDRAFSESSNLSKHLRTHTGVRPYSCAAPGCTKSFSRPDQLARHMAVHRKKATPAYRVPVVSGNAIVQEV